MIDPSRIWAATVERVAGFTRVTARAIVAGGQAADCVTHARMLAYYLAIVELGAGYRELARVAGVDHQTISKGVERIQERRDEDPALDAAIDQLTDGLRRRLGITLELIATNDNGREVAAH